MIHHSNSIDCDGFTRIRPIDNQIGPSGIESQLAPWSFPPGNDVSSTQMVKAGISRHISSLMSTARTKTCH